MEQTRHADSSTDDVHQPGNYFDRDVRYAHELPETRRPTMGTKENEGAERDMEWLYPDALGRSRQQMMYPGSRLVKRRPDVPAPICRPTRQPGRDSCRFDHP